MDPETVEIIRKIALFVDRLLYCMARVGFIGAILGIMVILIAATREVRMKGVKLLVISITASMIGFVYLLG